MKKQFNKRGLKLIEKNSFIFLGKMSIIPFNLPTLRLPTWLQSESRQYDNKYIYPDCRYRQILLEFTGCGWHFYIIINSIFWFAL